VVAVVHFRHNVAMTGSFDQDSNRLFWMGRANRLRWLVNLGWWWSGFTKLFMVGCFLAAVALFTLRSAGWPSEAVWISLAIWTAVAGLIAWLRSRRSFIRMDSALSRLDVAYGFHHRLISAHAGVGEWPPEIRRHDRPFTMLPVRWKWSHAARPLALSVLMLGMAFKLPVSTMDATPEIVRHEPPEWKAVESLIDILRERELVQEDALIKVEEQIAALRRKPQEEWYRQGTLEATSHLHNQMERDAGRFQKALEKTAALMEAAQAMKKQSNLNNLSLEAAQAQWKELMEQLGLESLPLDESMLQELKKIDLSKLRQMTAEELKDLEAKLKEQSDALRQCLVAAGMARMDGPGTGEVSRGPGTLPLTLNDEESRVDDAVPQALSNPNLDRAALGQTIGLADGEHNVDTDAYRELSEAGMTASPGGEGEVVWRQTVLPSEQKILKQYFK